MADHIPTGRGDRAIRSQSEVEAEMGLRPIEELLARRAQLIRDVAPLRALYGSFGTFDDMRKVELSRIKGLIRAEATAEGRKVSNDIVNDEAHAHPDYVDYITKATNERAHWVNLEGKVEAIEWYIRRGQSVASYLTAECRL
jgi:hypothetical protein